MLGLHTHSTLWLVTQHCRTNRIVQERVTCPDGSTKISTEVLSLVLSLVHYCIILRRETHSAYEQLNIVLIVLQGLGSVLILTSCDSYIYAMIFMINGWFVQGMSL